MNINAKVCLMCLNIITIIIIIIIIIITKYEVLPKNNNKI
jgi:hypothetical protein